VTDIKFCGMTRAEDAKEGVALGARYIGVILTESPRRMSPDRARFVFAGVSSPVRRVGVVGRESPRQIASLAHDAGVDVVQLHGDQTPEALRDLRAAWKGEVWWVARVEGPSIPAATLTMAPLVDAVVLDARVSGKLGGTGRILDWHGLAADVTRLRALTSNIVLAGGLTADNVRQAVDALRPDVVDVSSGVESAVGVKDHDRMRAFRDAVRNGAQG